MTDCALWPGSDHLDIADVQRRVKAIFIDSVGNPDLFDHTRHQE
jgi:hypothetical protein